jgi:hypothetical protein
MMEKNFVMLSDELQEKYHVEIRYVLFKCTVCGKTWGTTVDGTEVQENSLVCRDCAGEFLYNSLNG